MSRIDTPVPIATLGSVDERRRAAVYVASRARNADDLAHLLDVLGLDPKETQQ